MAWHWQASGRRGQLEDDLHGRRDRHANRPHRCPLPVQCPHPAQLPAILAASRRGAVHAPGGGLQANSGAALANTGLSEFGHAAGGSHRRDAHAAANDRPCSPTPGRSARHLLATPSAPAVARSSDRPVQRRAAAVVPLPRAAARNRLPVPARRRAAARRRSTAGRQSASGTGSLKAPALWAPARFRQGCPRCRSRKGWADH